MLAHVATIIPGHPFRSRVESAADGQVIVVQARDLTEDGVVDLAGAARLSDVKIKNPALPGDVILQPRGNCFSVALFQGASQPTIVAAPLYLIRPDASRLLPAFLVALLRAPQAQAALRQFAAGTHVPQVSRQALEELALELPDLDAQSRLLDLAQLSRREEELMRRLRDARRRLFDLAVTEASRKARRCANTPGAEPDPDGAPTPQGPCITV